MKILYKLIFTIAVSISIYSQSIEQKLTVIQNDGTLGGSLVVSVDVKGTDLGTANTLGSATIDIVFDKTKLTYTNVDSWAFGFLDGYTRELNPNQALGTARIAATGTSVSPSQGPVGFDITSTYVEWVHIIFTISDATGSTDISIIPGTNQIGLFENHANNPATGVINNQTLTTPIVISNEPLPVELSNFTAANSNSNVNLSWETATEVDNYGFEIERALDSEDKVWENIGFVTGYGNSNSPKEYSYVDHSPIGGNKFVYRLKQIDNDGTFTYSDVVEVEVIPNQYELYQNYPNPFNPSTTVRFSLRETQNVKIVIFDQLGQEVQTIVNQQYEAGYHEFEFNASNFASGVYFYRIIAGDFVNVKKMMLLK